MSGTGSVSKVTTVRFESDFATLSDFVILEFTSSVENPQSASGVFGWYSPTTTASTRTRMVPAEENLLSKETIIGLSVEIAYVGLVILSITIYCLFCTRKEDSPHEIRMQMIANDGDEHKSDDTAAL